MMDTFFGGFGVMALFAIVLNLAFVVFVVVVVVLGVRWLIRNTNEGQRAGPPDDAAMATLRERFARGEIDPDEFEQRRRALGG